MIMSRKPILLKLMIIPKVLKLVEDNMGFAEKIMRKKREKAIKLAPAAGVLKTRRRFPPLLINFPLYCY